MRKGILRVATGLALLAGLYTGPAAAAELKVLCAEALRPAVEELAPAFEKSAGHKLSIQYDTAENIEKKVAAEDPIDVAILTKAQVDKLVRVARISCLLAPPRLIRSRRSRPRRSSISSPRRRTRRSTRRKGWNRQHSARPIHRYCHLL